MKVLTVTFIFFILSNLLLAETKIAPPLVDGDCSEYSDAQKIPLSKEVTMYVYQDDHYLWLCYAYPDESFGTLDLTLQTKSLPEPLNLHVSAQLGEWPANKPDLAPKTPESELWWNAKGWTVNPVWINGMDKTSEPPRYRFKNAKARELQLSKQRFGSGEWKIKLNILRIKGADGQFYDIDFPKDGSDFLLNVK